MEKTKVNCRQCRHYFMTWEAKNPHGCRMMGFKSPLLPSIYVYKNSGQECRSFMPKPPRPR